jgi:hypothetical protein
MNLQPPRQRLFGVLWAAFLAASVLELIVFALVDPRELRWFGGETLNLAPNAVYTLAFLLFWAVSAFAAALALLLCGRPQGAAPLRPS